MQANELRNTNRHHTSDTYRAAYRMARIALGDTPLSEPVITRMSSLSGELATMLRDSTEDLRDDRKICRQAALDAVRQSLMSDTERVIEQLDEIRMRIRDTGDANDQTILDAAICAALQAQVGLNDRPFRETLKNLEAARMHMNRIALTPRPALSFDLPMPVLS